MKRDLQTWGDLLSLRNQGKISGVCWYEKFKRNNNNNDHCELCRSGCPQSKIERKWKEGYVPRTCKGIENSLEHESDGHQRIDKKTGGLEIDRTNGDYPNYYIIKIR